MMTVVSLGGKKIEFLLCAGKVTVTKSEIIPTILKFTFFGKDQVNKSLQPWQQIIIGSPNLTFRYLKECHFEEETDLFQRKDLR